MNLQVSSLSDTIAALKKMDGKIRGQHRNLTRDEWEMVRGAIETHELPCRLIAGPYGFSLLIYAHSDLPEVIKPDMLLDIEDFQFPFPSAERGFGGQEETLRELAAITHRRRNHDLLAYYRFEPMMDVKRYAY